MCIRAILIYHDISSFSFSLSLSKFMYYVERRGLMGRSFLTKLHRYLMDYTQISLLILFSFTLEFFSHNLFLSYNFSTRACVLYNFP